MECKFCNKNEASEDAEKQIAGYQVCDICYNQFQEEAKSEVEQQQKKASPSAGLTTCKELFSLTC